MNPRANTPPPIHAAALWLIGAPSTTISAPATMTVTDSRTLHHRNLMPTR